MARSTIERKKDIYKRYTSNLSCIQEKIRFFEHNFEFTTPWFIDCIAKNRDELQVFLKENMIGTRIMYPPINKQKAYNESEDISVSEVIGTKGIWLPSSINLSISDIDFISNKIIAFYK